MTGACQRVAIITGGSQGVGASLVAAYRRLDWAVVANSRTSKPSEDGAVPTISGCPPGRRPRRVLYQRRHRQLSRAGSYDRSAGT
jgi:NAD(P)-dependent dehydrogenase (short-subunit alcohol dehydrogenase family)